MQYYLMQWAIRYIIDTRSPQTRFDGKSKKPHKSRSGHNEMVGEPGDEIINYQVYLGYSRFFFYTFSFLYTLL